MTTTIVAALKQVMKQSKKFFGHIPKKLRISIVKNLRIIRAAFKEESVETASMLKTYLDYGQGRVGAKEMEKANAQFRNLLKTLGLGALAILPFSPVTIPLIVKLGDKFGVDILPPSIRKQINPDDLK